MEAKHEKQKVEEVNIFALMIALMVPLMIGEWTLGHDTGSLGHNTGPLGHGTAAPLGPCADCPWCARAVS